MPVVLASTEPRGIEIDASAYPFVSLRFGRFSDEDFDAYLEEMTRLVDRPGPRVLLVDCTSSILPSAEMRRKQLAWNTEHRERIRDTVGGAAFVIPSAVMRGVISAIFWITPFEAPHVIVKTVEEGMAACHHWLAHDEPALL